MLRDNEILLDMARDKHIDFYLEDDMFEIEGQCRKKDETYLVEDMSAVGHIMGIIGQELEVCPRGKKLFACRKDTGKTFEMEVNRIYDRLTDLKENDVDALRRRGVTQFFHKETDTLIWFDEKEERWYIELNKINMYFSGERTSYETIGELLRKNSQYMGGNWQALYYVATTEEIA